MTLVPCPLSFLTITGWKRLLLADSPRQAINALTLYAVWLVKKDNPGNWYDISKYFKGNSLSTSALTVTTFFTVAVCAGSLLFLAVAGICYIPLLLHIRGNLKEYCCHKVDKVSFLSCHILFLLIPCHPAHRCHHQTKAKGTSSGG